MKRIKFLSNGIESSAIASWRRQLPDRAQVIGDCEFILDAQARDYDWLAVYDRFPSAEGERFSMWREELACPPENTVFITVEPSSIKSYEPAFLNQFGHVLTGHEPWSIRHPGIIRSQPGLRWFYGAAGDGFKSLDEMLAEPQPVKTRDISTVCSNKQHKHTLHQKRYHFSQRLKTAMPELEIYGRGVRDMKDKAEAIDPYRYHIAIENHRCDHHWTEKVSDVFLGWSLPIYCGCTNLADYFPRESFIEIDIDDFDGALRTIRAAIHSNEYEKRIDAIIEARSRVLKDYNLFSVLARIADGTNRPEPHHPDSRVILSRHALRKSGIMNLLTYAAQSLQRKWRFRKGG